MDTEMDPMPSSAAAAGGVCVWSCLSTDLTELILSLLPLRSVVRAATVCKLWRSLVAHPSFATRVSAAARKPWFFLHGRNNVLPSRNLAFAFDPEEPDGWIHLLPVSLSASDHRHHAEDCFVGSGGFLFATTASTRTNFCYAPLLRHDSDGGGWRETPPLRFSRCNPLVGVFPSGSGAGARFIVAGGVPFVGGLVNIAGPLAVEIYDPGAGAWELCPPMPPEFESGNSSQWLSSALLGSRSFYVSGIYSGSLACFDLFRRAWGGVRTLRPPGVLFSFLVACRDRLVLAGLRSTADDGGPSFVLWMVENGEGAAEWREMGAMPEEMLCGLFDGEEDERFASLKCVGLDGLVYVFNDAHHRAYPACVCEIGGDGRCRWKKLPPLPGPLNQFHRVIAFCSPVPLDSILGGGGAGGGGGAAAGGGGRPAIAN